MAWSLASAFSAGGALAADVPFITRPSISTTADGANSVYAADVDGDGDVDVLSASFFDDKIAWYENDGNPNPSFVRRTISTAANGARSVYAADVDGDGDVDVLSASSSDDKIRWYRNDRVHSQEFAITSAIGNTNEIAVADVDGDGDLDVLSASSTGYAGQVLWHENTVGTGTAWVDRPVSTSPFAAATSIAAVDVDGDDDVDAVSASGSFVSGLLAWHENLDAGGGLWAIRTITTMGFPSSAAAADLDGDGDADVLSASYLTDTIAWHENAIGDGSVWAAHTINVAADGARSIIAADIDGDDDLDALSASFNDDKIAWYENALGDGSAWSLHTIDTGADGAGSVIAVDVDGDGDADVVSASEQDDKIAWYENSAGNGSAWRIHTVSTSADSARSVAAADVDGDGDVDLVSVSYGDDTIAWHENTAGDGSLWDLQTIALAANGVDSVAAADIDGDGAMDAVAGSFQDPNLAWYRIEVPQILVMPSSGLLTSELGASELLDVRLRAQATRDVRIFVGIAPADEAEADQSFVSFTSLNWAVPQTLLISGRDDPIDDGDISYVVVLDPTVSDDTRYAQLDPVQIDGINLNEDQAGVNVAPTAGLNTTEAGGIAQFTVTLLLEPVADVTIDVTSLDPTEGLPDQASLTFSTLNWSIPQTVIVTGQNDQVEDGNVPYVVRVGPISAADGYANIDPDDVSLTNIDDGNDVAGVTVSPTSGLTTTEGGGIAQFNVNLTSEPADDITISVTSDDPSEGLPDRGSLTFSPGNWQSLQTVIVTGEDDPLDDGDTAYTIQLGPIASNDGVYAAIDPDDVSFTNIDDDENVSAGVFVRPTSGLTTTEGGGIAQFEVVLITQPSDTLAIAVASDDPTEGVANTASLSFSPANWNVEQTVTVTGQGDPLTDGNVAYSVLLGPITSNDAVYAAIDPDDVSLTNIDDEPIFADGFED